jgi:hypothetical protein
MDGILNWRGTDDDHSEGQFNSVADSNYGICLIILYSGRTFWVGLIFLCQNSSEPDFGGRICRGGF